MLSNIMKGFMKSKKEKEQKKNEAWKMRVCNKIASEPNFPNNAIIQMYLSNNHTNFTGNFQNINIFSMSFFLFIVTFYFVKST